MLGVGQAPSSEKMAGANGIESCIYIQYNDCDRTFEQAESNTLVSKTPLEEVESARGALRPLAIPIAFDGARVAPFSFRTKNITKDDAWPSVDPFR